MAWQDGRVERGRSDQRRRRRKSSTSPAMTAMRATTPMARVVPVTGSEDLPELSADAAAAGSPLGVAFSAAAVAGSLADVAEAAAAGADSEAAEGMVEDPAATADPVAPGVSAPVSCAARAPAAGSSVAVGAAEAGAGRAGADAEGAAGADDPDDSADPEEPEESLLVDADSFDPDESAVGVRPTAFGSE